MEASITRWKRAQEAEAEHDAHSDGVWQRERTISVLREHFERDLDTFRGKRILEVGSGTGMVHSLDIDCTAVGIDPLTYEYREVLTDSDAHTLSGVGERLPFTDGEFDIVFSYNVLDHCKSPSNVLDEIRRVLDDDGELLLQVNTFEIPEVIRSRLGLIDSEHPHHFSSDVVDDLLRRSGFTIDRRFIETRYDFLSDPVIKEVASLLFRIRRYCVTSSLK